MEFNQARVVFSGTLAIAVIVSETYAMFALNQAISRLVTGAVEAVIFISIAWFGFGYGSKASRDPFQRKTVVLLALVTWAISSSTFRLLYNSMGGHLATGVIPFFVVAAMSYFAGKTGREIGNLKRGGS